MMLGAQTPSYDSCLGDDMAAILRHMFPEGEPITSSRLEEVCAIIDALEGCTKEERRDLKNQVVEFLVVERGYPMGHIPMVLKGRSTCPRLRIQLARWQRYQSYQDARRRCVEEHPAGTLLAVAG